MSAKCIILMHKKNRELKEGAEDVNPVHFIKVRCTKFQKLKGIHHAYAIDHAKMEMEMNGEDPDAYSFLSFDYEGGAFMRSMYRDPAFIKIWKGSVDENIIHIGPSAGPDRPDLDEEVDQYPFDSTDENGEVEISYKLENE